MASKSELQSELSSLTSLKYDLDSISSQLGYADKNCSLLSAQIKDNYSLDNDIKAVSLIGDISNDLDGYKSYINNTIIPSINSRIQSINTEIANIEAQEALEAASLSEV